MDAKEAIERLDEFAQQQSNGYSIHIANGGQDNEEFELLMDDLKIAIEALEKQVPKEPTNAIFVNGIVLGGNCPNCGFEIGISAYCGYCGQSIKWLNPINKKGVIKND